MTSPNQAEKIGATSSSTRNTDVGKPPTIGPTSILIKTKIPDNKTNGDIEKEIQSLQFEVERLKKLKETLEEQKTALQTDISSDLKHYSQTTEHPEHKIIFTGLSESLDSINKSQSDKLCIICNSAQREIAFLDCCHVVACENCSSKLITCPIDKSAILVKKKILFS